MNQLLIVVLLLAVIVIAAYFYMKRAQRRDAGTSVATADSPSRFEPTPTGRDTSAPSAEAQGAETPPASGRDAP